MFVHYHELALMREVEPGESFGPDVFVPLARTGTGLVGYSPLKDANLVYGVDADRDFAQHSALADAAVRRAADAGWEVWASGMRFTGGGEDWVHEGAPRGCVARMCLRAARAARDRQRNGWDRPILVYLPQFHKVRLSKREEIEVEGGSWSSVEVFDAWKELMHEGHLGGVYVVAHQNHRGGFRPDVGIPGAQPCVGTYLGNDGGVLSAYHGLDRYVPYPDGQVWDGGWFATS